MKHLPDFTMPSVEEVLRGETQGGVPRPAVLDRDETPILTTADLADRVKHARDEVAASVIAYTAAGDRLSDAQDALRGLETAFAKAVEKEFFS